MCSPAAMYAATAAVAAGGAIMQGMAGSSEAKTNSRIAKDNAGASRSRAAADEAMTRRSATKVIGQSKVDYAKAGVKLTGTALDMLEQQTAEAELDALKVRAGGEADAINYENEAKMSRQRGTSAKVGAGFGVADSLLSGASSWQNYQQQEKLLKAAS